MGVGVIGTLMAGWASANKYSLLGGLRSAAQLMAYELPFVLAAASVAMAAGTLSLTDIVEAWQPWWLIWQLPAGVVFFVAGLAELNRPPFDMPVADAEIIFGPYTEYTGLRFALFLLAEYAGIVVLWLLTAVLFLGGWNGPFGDQLVVVDLAQDDGGVVRRDLAAGELSAAARRPAAEALLAGLIPVALLQLALTGVVKVLYGESPRSAMIYSPVASGSPGGGPARPQRALLPALRGRARTQPVGVRVTRGRVNKSERS